MKKILVGIGFIFFLAILIILLLAIKTRQEIRRKAAVPGGTASITLSPGSTALTTGQPVTLTLAATIPQSSVDGIQIVATVTGAVPVDFTYHPAILSGLSIIPVVVEELADGKKIKVAFVTKDPNTPLISNTIISIGTFTFTPNQKGSIKIQFDTTYSKIAQHQTTKDILGIPASYMYTIVPPNYCSGPDGSRCEYTVCTPCTGRLCPKNPCRERIGVCRGNVCGPR